MSSQAAPTDPSKQFFVRLTAATGGGMFLDGFIFAAIAAVIAEGTFTHDLGLSGAMLGLVSASTLIGTLIGSPTIGYLTDIVGRKPMFLIDLGIFLICSLMMLGAASAWEVIALGVLLGIAIGGDYSIGSPLLGEYTSARNRGYYLGILEILWNVGYVVEFLIGYLILHNFPQGWHYVLASSAVPAALILLLRHGLPESPRWLASKGRTEEANQILADVGLKQNAAEYQDEKEEKTRWATLFDKEYISRTVFCSVFWVCIVIPYFGLTFFQAEVLRTIGLHNAVVGAVIGTCVALVGATTGWFLLDRIGRRPILVVPMFATAVCLGLVALNKELHFSVAITIICFFGYLFFYGVMSILPGVYPLEVYPTAVRTSGVGLSSATSRVGAAAGTFLLPIGLAHFGLSPVLFVLAFISLIGGVTSYTLAPETAGKTLSECGSRKGTDRYIFRPGPTAPA